jgi:hypothetical protein
VFDDLLENGGEAMSGWVEQLLPFYVNYSQEDDLDLLQSASYGLGVCAQVNNNAFAPFLQSKHTICNVHALTVSYRCARSYAQSNLYVRGVNQQRQLYFSIWEDHIFMRSTLGC